MRLNNASKKFRSFCTKCVRSRNIIIVSEEKVEHFPISPRLQLLALLGIIAVFSGISYTTGSFMAAKNVLREKDQKILTTSIANKRILHEFSLLKRDLEKFAQNDGEFTEYDKFIISQYKGEPAPETVKTGFVGWLSEKTSAKEDDKLMDRISFLENKVQDLEQNNQAFVEAVKQRTDNHIEAYKDIIEMTGLDAERLRKLAERDRKTNAHKDQNASYSTSDGKSMTGEGGPYIPLEVSGITEDEKAMFDNIDNMVILGQVVDRLPLAKPLQKSVYRSGFGKRIDPFTRRWAMHAGVDMAGAAGSSVLSTNNGTVKFAGKKAAYGNMVEIDHGYGITTCYAHMSKILVKDGQTIVKGQPVGIQGSTGRSTGPHVHYEVRYNGKPLNPQKFLNAGSYVLKN